MKTATAVANWISPTQKGIVPASWLDEFGSRLELVFRGSPVAIASMFVATALTAFVVVFALKRDRFLEAAPSLAVLDDLTYKSVTVAFPLLTLMTITGAVWANESWGRYWGWDPKETWALITCICYAIFLHTRIVHGWKGRKTAMFAVIGFISVIFTYLGVSFILPGLHSYATL
ncbi:MAG: cytochrome c biogenesis protein CcsA [Blastocatellia bacterium]|nr:cytochrome c biogenesis protein CcsA [Blastocatellia bacterium]